MNAEKINMFENEAIPKAVAKLAVPSVLGTLVMILYNIADTYFVGMINNPIETAAVSLAAPVVLAFNAVTNLFGVGSASMMSRSLGKRDYETVKRTAAFGFYLSGICAVLISIIYFIFEKSFLHLLGANEITSFTTSKYLFWTVTCGAVPAILNVILSNMVRAEGEALHASIGVMSGCILNIILDPFFVLPRFLNMGAAGAGLATCISNTISMLYLLIVIFLKRKTTCICLNPLKFGFRKDIVKEVFGVGIPASIQNLLNVAGTILLNNCTAVYGESAVSAMGICHKVNLMPLYVSMGITQGVMPLISYNYSSGDRKRMKDTIIYVLKLTIIITILFAVGYYIFAGNLIKIFMKDEMIIGHGTILLRAMSLGIPFLAIDFMAVAVYQSIGKGKYSLYFAIARKIILEIPAILILNKFYPLYGMGYSQTFAEFVLAIAALFMLNHIFKSSAGEEIK